MLPARSLCQKWGNRSGAFIESGQCSGRPQARGRSGTTAVSGHSENKSQAAFGQPHGRKEKMSYSKRQRANTIEKGGPGREPPVEEPPNAPRKPPVKEPEKPPESPPPPRKPPVEEPPNRPPEPPVEEPPPADPNRKPTRPPVRRAHPMTS